MSSKRIRYNQAVLEELRKTAPPVAEKLNAYGSRLGWWDSLDYWRMRGMLPTEAAARLCEQIKKESPSE